MSRTCIQPVGFTDSHYELELENRIRKTIVTKPPNLTLDNNCGLESEKLLLKKSIILPFLYPTEHKYPFSRFLLFGPSGTGKTYLARAIVGEAITKGKEKARSLTFFSVSPPDIRSEWLGESEKLIVTLFSLAKRASPSLIFMDDIQSLFKPRSPNDDEYIGRMKSVLKREMDAMKENGQVFFIAAANSLDDLDDPLLGRFDNQFIYIPLPEKDVRTEMFHNFLSGSFLSDITPEDVLRFARISTGFTSGEIRDACEHAKDAKDVLDAIRATEPITSTTDITKFNKFAKERAGWENSEVTLAHEPTCVEIIFSCLCGTTN